MFELRFVEGTPHMLALRSFEGRGPRIIYLHGLGLSGTQDWPHVAASEALAGRASIALDLLGFGKSPRPADFSYDLADQARLVAKAVCQAGDGVALVGHSMGGALAVLLAEHLLRSGQAPEAVILAEANLRAQDATLSARAASITEEEFRAQWPRWVTQAETPYYRAGMNLTDPIAFHRSAVSLVRHSQHLLPRFAALDVKRKGFIVGGKSGETARETAQLVATAGVPVVTLPSSGHAFCDEDPSGFALAVSQLLP